jgi:23S rRNA pseudouridine1911/1915/1917 synthase
MGASRRAPSSKRRAESPAAPASTGGAKRDTPAGPGPTPEWRASGDAVGGRLDKFIAHPDRLGSRSRAVAALERGKVFVNGTEVTLDDAGRRLIDGDVVRVWMDRPGSSRHARRPGPAGDLWIMYEDDALIVVNKPPGLLSVPLERRAEASSVQDQLADHLRPRGKRRPFVVHRIDRDTSGLVVFAVRADAQRRLREQFKRHDAERIYLAVVYGHPSPAEGAWHDRLVWDDRALIQKETHPRDPDGKDAVAEYRTLERFRETSLIEVRLITGKRNQIRLQARLRGHTLVGEQRYVYGPDTLRGITFARQALHAYRLGLRHPDTDKPLQFEAPVPADMAELIARLKQ